MSVLGDIYQAAFKEYKLCNDSVSNAKLQVEFNEKWKNTVKTQKDKQIQIQAAKTFLQEIQNKRTKKKAQNILTFFKSSTSQVSTTISNISNFESPTQEKTQKVFENKEKEIEVSKNENNKRKIQKTPAQDNLNNEIRDLNIELQGELLKKNAGFGTIETQKNIKKLTANIDEKKHQLETLQKSAKRSKIYRDQRNAIIKNASIIDPKLGKSLKIHEQRGRPRLEVSQHELLNTIVQLVTFGASAEDKRRSEALNCCKTLTDLQKELSTFGFEISRSAVYLRLLPKRANSSEGKKHVNTVPVRLKRAETNLHKNHVDQNFCTATIRGIETLASILGPNQCIFLSQDDKARVPLGITAANKQAPMLMHLNYQIRLPDHDWVVADRHKLIPSVYALISIKEEQMGRPEAVSYSGPTYIAIRSGKHSSSTASTHASDFERLLKIESCKNIMIDNGSDSVKPVLFMSVDGGPDENPRYQKVIQHIIAHFKKYNLDAIYVFTNAPGRSAFNRVERRMAPLSRELSGVILEHEHFGSHLSNSGKTINLELEKQNFKHAGDVLASIWNNMVIDKYEVVAEYIESMEQPEILELPSAAWYSVHIRESQYLLQVVKCSDKNCCSPCRSGLEFILQDRFFPPPYPIIQNSTGFETPPPQSNGHDKFAPLLLRLSTNIKPIHANFLKMPYDYYCPSVQKDLVGRTCDVCGLYFVTKKGLKSHKEQLHKKSVNVCKVKPRRILTRRNQEMLCCLEDQSENDSEIVEWIEEDIVDVDGVQILEETNSSSIPIIENLKSWATNDQFEEVFFKNIDLNLPCYSNLSKLF